MPEENPNFFVSEWTPQLELLSHPAVKTGITHCGFGGTNDFIITGKPTILFPHADDQHKNADLLFEAGCGPTLHNVVAYSSDFRENVTRSQKVFEADHVTKVVKDALENPKYKENIIKMRMK